MKPKLNLHYVDPGGFIHLSPISVKRAVREVPALVRELYEELGRELRAYDAERSQLPLFEAPKP